MQPWTLSLCASYHVGSITPAEGDWEDKAGYTRD